MGPARHPLPRTYVEPAARCRWGLTGQVRLPPRIRAL
jgi:hypothetical protein